LTDYEDILSGIDQTKHNTSFTEPVDTVIDHSIPMPIKAADVLMNQNKDLLDLPNKKHGAKLDKLKKASKQVNPEQIENECDKMIQEMEAAYLADLENNQMGKPSFNKLQVLDKIMHKIKYPLFAEIFLDKNGLEQFHNFLKRLPDGSWPLNSIRKTILETVYTLPISVHHLKYTKLGKTITAIQQSKNETPENKKLAQLVKDKWSRIVTGNIMDYPHLEELEKENLKLMKKRRKGCSHANFAGSVSKGTQELNTNGTVSIKSKFKMSYNFAVRPQGASMLGKREFAVPTKTSEVDKYLTKLRKARKFA